MRTTQTTKILFHGKLADVLGRDLEMEAPKGCSIGKLRAHIATEHPNAGEALRDSRVRACVGDSIVADSYLLAPGDEVEFLPPVSGG